MLSLKNALAKQIASESCDPNYEVYSRAISEFTQAIEMPVRKSIFDGNNLFNIFEQADFRDLRCQVEFPLDPVTPGTEGQYVAHSIPDCSALPCAMLQGDYVIVPTYRIGHCVEWCIRRARYNNFIQQRSIDAFRAGFVKKMNTDGWHVLLAAGLDRNIVVHDPNAATGQFTKRLPVMMKTLMRRNGGGNASSANRSRLTDLFMSPEVMDDVYNWNIDQIPEAIQTEIHRSPNCDMGLTNLFCVNFHVVDELGEGQEYQLYYENELGGSMPVGKNELIVGLDLQNRDSFVMPIREDLQMFPDLLQHKAQRTGVYGWAEIGVAALSNQRVILAAV